jgi:hypothetical protein
MMVEDEMIDLERTLTTAAARAVIEPFHRRHHGCIRLIPK